MWSTDSCECFKSLQSNPLYGHCCLMSQLFRCCYADEMHVSAFLSMHCRTIFACKASLTSLLQLKRENFTVSSVFDGCNTSSICNLPPCISHMPNSLASPTLTPVSPPVTLTAFPPPPPCHFLPSAVCAFQHVAVSFFPLSFTTGMCHREGTGARTQAATMLQARWRGFVARKECAALCEDAQRQR